MPSVQNPRWLTEEYATKALSPEVVARFRTYEKYPPSRSVEYIQRYFEKRDQFPQHDQTFAALKLPPDYPKPFVAQREVSATIVPPSAQIR